jgi:hypothetical protein
MNKTKREKYVKNWRQSHHVVWLPKEDYKDIQKFCERHGLNFVKWAVITLKNEIARTENVPPIDLTD